MPRCFSSHNVSISVSSLFSFLSLFISVSSSVHLFFSSSLVFHFLFSLFSLLSSSSLLSLVFSSLLLFFCSSLLLVFLCHVSSSSVSPLPSSLLCLSPSLSPCVVLCCCVVLCGVVLCCVVWCVARLGTQKNLAGTTRTCVTTCGRGAGTHGDVLNLHTEGVLNGDTPSSPPPTHHTHTQKKKTKENKKKSPSVLLTKNLPTKGYHAPQRFTERNHWMTIQHECSHIFLSITTHGDTHQQLRPRVLSYESMLTC